MASLALNYVVNLLARREYSEYELRCKMQEKAFSEEEIEQALRICQEKTGRAIGVSRKTIYITDHKKALA